MDGADWLGWIDGVRPKEPKAPRQAKPTQQQTHFSWLALWGQWKVRVCELGRSVFWFLSLRLASQPPQQSIQFHWIAAWPNQIQLISLIIKEIEFVWPALHALSHPSNAGAQPNAFDWIERRELRILKLWVCWLINEAKGEMKWEFNGCWAGVKTHNQQPVI